MNKLWPTGRRLAFLLLFFSFAVNVLAAQDSVAVPIADTIVLVRVRVTADSLAGPSVASAIVRSGLVGAQTDSRGETVLRLAPGSHTVLAAKLGYRPDTSIIALRAGADTSLTFVLVEQAAEIEAVVVSATRAERRVEDTPLRVEVIDEEEIAEKVAMTPGDIAMMLNETAGLRVQATNPSLGGANVRIQGLRGRYSLILADGLPLYGGQTGGLGLLQIPPVDLGRVEVIKGTASALYGSSALGGVINLVSRRPGDEAAHTALLNQTSRGGTDAVGFFSGPLTSRWGYTLLAGAHRQRQNDLDDDGWTDMPGYERAVVRPRLHFDNGGGRTAFLTAGLTLEDRDGGTVDGGTIPGGGPYVESLGTRRGDVGGLARLIVADGALGGSVLTVRGAAMEQRHEHHFGSVGEDDRHRTWFAEAAMAVPRTLGGRAITYIAGVAYQQEAYRADDVSGFDYTYDIPSAFGQIDVDPAEWMSLSMSARVDGHSDYGTMVNPRISVLLRGPNAGAVADWTVRLSGGTGAFAPTPFTEETESTGLTPLAQLSNLVAERARSASLDVGGALETSLGSLEVNATTFASVIRHPLQVRETDGRTPLGTSMVELVNAPDHTRTWGGELLARLVRELGDDSGDEPPALRITGTYTFLRSTECNPDLPTTVIACVRREVPLTPRHSAGVVASVEQEGKSRIGLELYYTGRQQLDDNPYRQESRPYLIVGLLGERAFETRVGVARVFLNLENLTNVRQTRYDPLLLPSRGPGGRWTTEAWTDLSGFTVNGGVRLGF